MSIVTLDCTVLTNNYSLASTRESVTRRCFEELSDGGEKREIYMTQVEQLAAFVVRKSYEDLSEEARQQLKIRILDALGCAIGALEGPPIKMLRAQLKDFGGKPLVTMFGGDKTA